MKKRNIKAGIILGTSLLTTPILNTSCLLQPKTNTNTVQNYKEPTVSAEDFELIPATIGGENGFQFYKVDDSLIYEDYETEASNCLNEKFKVHATQSITELYNSITDEDTKNYLSKCYQGISTINRRNLDGVITDIDHSCAYIFADLIKALPSKTEKIKFCYDFELIANEVYYQSFPYHDNFIKSYYSENKNDAIDNLEKCGVDKTSLITDIANNCVKTVDEYQQLLVLATKRLNQEKNLQLTPTQMKQLNSIVFSAKFIESTHDSTPSSITCGIKSTLNLQRTMKTIAQQSKTTDDEIVR